MKHFLLCCLVVSLTTTAPAQWVHQNPLPTSRRLFDIAWPSREVMILASGEMHRSSDMGTTWTTLVCGDPMDWTAGPFMAMHALNEEVVLAVNSVGMIRRSGNGGDTWTIVSAEPAGPIVTRFAFLDERHGVLGYGHEVIRHTTDGGRSWTMLPPARYVGHSLAIAMRTPTAWAMATEEGEVHLTTDSGENWHRIRLSPTMTPKPLYDIHFADSLQGVVVGTNGAALTTDGGSTWRFQDDLVTFELLDVTRTSAGWVAVGREGFIMRSDDGMSWQRVASGTTQDLMSMAFRDGLNGVVLGSRGTLLLTGDGGVSFSVLRDPMLPQLRAVSFCDSLHGIAAGLGGAILQTTNGGASWQRGATSITTDLVTAAWASPTTGIVAGRGALHHTTDGGVTWQLSLATDSTFARVAIKGACALAVTTRGELHASGDTGRTWRTVECGSPAMLTAVSIIDDDAWVVAGPRTVLFTDNAGAEWDRKAGFTSPQLQSMQFIDRRTGWIVERDSMSRTTDGGATFTRTLLGYGLKRLYFTDARYGVHVQPQTVMRTTDGGATWSLEYFHYYGALWDVHFPDAGHGWVVGDNGVILSTRSVLPPVSVEAPEASTPSWTLEAWPQPARGVLNIALRGDLRATVTLRLVDMLGRAVGGVIERAPGAQHAVFDVGTLPPGAYAIIASTPDATRVHRILTY
jgi:photosystem II stability/assembly factor-like uncharacterized protein